RLEFAAPGSVEGIVATEFVPHGANVAGQELLLSVKQDAAFGPVVVIGLGGVLTEWYGEGTGGRSRLILPVPGLTRQRVSVVLEHHPLLSLLCRPSRLYPEPPLSADILADRVMDLAELAAAYGPGEDGEFTIEELEINPAVARDGELVAIDGVGLVSRRKWPKPDRPLVLIEKLLHPRSAAVLGVSARSANPGRIIMRNLQHSRGVAAEKLHVVHPERESIDGVACVRSISELPARVDLAVVCIPAAGARDAIAELVERDAASTVILIPGGFAESGNPELARDIEASLAAGHARGDGGPVMVGGNCLGIVSRDEYNTFFLPPYKLPFADAAAGGNLALVSQSGAYLVAFASNYDGVINPRASISFGNQMDLTVADFLAHFLRVDAVDVIGCYVEGFQPGDGARFAAFAREAAAKGKQVIVFKAGKTPLGAQAAASHTASLAGDYDVTRACLEEAGVLVAETLEDFEDLVKTFTMLMSRRARGNRLGVMSNAGFECSVVMDIVDGFTLRPFTPQVKAVLDEALPAFAHRDNPVDATPMADTASYVLAMEAIVSCAAIDCAIISSVPVTPALDNLPADPAGAHGENLEGPASQPREFIRILTRSDKPAVVVVDSGGMYDPMATMIEAAGIPVFRKIDRAARALAGFVARCLEMRDAAAPVIMEERS
ncbi:CoA-binding protein, partial [bacterium]|nr:CoA-binding protein [bacterium]